MVDSNCKQSLESCEFSQIIEEYLKDLNFHEDGYVSGYTDSAETFKKFIENLNEFGIVFSVRTSVKTDIKQQFSLHTNNFTINCGGSPFTVERTTYYQCTHGAKYFPSKKCKPKEPCEKTKPKRTNCSKKLDCPAKMVVKKLKVFPEYKVESIVWRKKQELLRKLRADRQTKQLCIVDRFVISISSPESHNHPLQKTKVLASALVNQICDLNAKGFHSVTEVKKLLSEFVDSMFENLEHKPSPHDETYYPTYQTVYKYMMKLKKRRSPLSGQYDTNNSKETSRDSGQHRCNPDPDMCQLTEPVSLPDTQGACNITEQVLLLYPGNELVSNGTTVPLSVLFIQDLSSEEIVPSNQVITEGTSSLADFTVVPVTLETTTNSIVEDLCSMNCDVEVIGQQSEQTLPQETTQLALLAEDELNECAISAENISEDEIGRKLEDASGKARQTLLELLDDIRAAVPGLNPQQVQMGINILKKCHSFFVCSK